MELYHNWENNMNYKYYTIFLKKFLQSSSFPEILLVEDQQQVETPSGRLSSYGLNYTVQSQLHLTCPLTSASRTRDHDWTN